jgi:hypothetical protein
LSSKIEAHGASRDASRSGFASSTRPAMTKR